MPENSASSSNEKSISDDEVPECISEKIDEGWDQDRAVAACLNMANEGSSEPDSVDGVKMLQYLTGKTIQDVFKTVEDVDTVPTQEMADVASQVLEKIDDSEFDNDDCGTRTGLERANQLENRESLSADTVGRMVSFFARHDGNQKVDEDVDSKWEDCGFVAWQLWGGDPGREWAERKMEEIEDAEEDPEKQLNDNMKSKTALKESIESQKRDNVKSKSFTVKGEDVEIVKQDSESEPVVNIPIQSLAEDRDGDIINEKGQESIIRQLTSGTVPLVPNHGVGKSDAHYGFEDIFGQFVDGDNRNGTTIGTARLLEGNEYTDKLIKLLENDMPVGFSVGFRVLEADERKEQDGLEISKVDLMEVSAVGIPSNPEAVPQAMGTAVAMAKNAGLTENQIMETIKKSFKHTMSEKQEDTETQNDSKSGEEVKQMTSEDVETMMELVAGKVSEHMGMAMDEAEDELMGMLDEDDEETDEMDEEEETDEMDDEEEERNADTEDSKDSDHNEEEDEKSESAESEKETVSSTADKNKSDKKTISKADESDNEDQESMQNQEKNEEAFDPFVPSADARL